MQRCVVLTISYFVLGWATPTWAAGPQPVPLWPEKAPGAVGEDESVRIHLPPKR